MIDGSVLSHDFSSIPGSLRSNIFGVDISDVSIKKKRPLFREDRDLYNLVARSYYHRECMKSKSGIGLFNA